MSKLFIHVVAKLVSRRYKLFSCETRQRVVNSISSTLVFQAREEMLRPSTDSLRSLSLSLSLSLLSFAFLNAYAKLQSTTG